MIICNRCGIIEGGLKSSKKDHNKVWQPEILIVYNEFYKGTDLMDQNMSQLIHRKWKRWFVPKNHSHTWKCSHGNVLGICIRHSNFSSRQCFGHRLYYGVLTWIWSFLDTRIQHFANISLQLHFRFVTVKMREKIESLPARLQVRQVVQPEVQRTRPHCGRHRAWKLTWTRATRSSFQFLIGVQLQTQSFGAHSRIIKAEAVAWDKLHSLACDASWTTDSIIASASSTSFHTISPRHHPANKRKRFIETNSDPDCECLALKTKHLILKVSKISWTFKLAWRKSYASLCTKAEPENMLLRFKSTKTHSSPATQIETVVVT